MSQKKNTNIMCSTKFVGHRPDWFQITYWPRHDQGVYSDRRDLFIFITSSITPPHCDSDLKFKTDSKQLNNKRCTRKYLVPLYFFSRLFLQKRHSQRMLKGNKFCVQANLNIENKALSVRMSSINFLYKKMYISKISLIRNPSSGCWPLLVNQWTTL